MADETELNDLRKRIVRLHPRDRASLLELVFADERRRWEAAHAAEEAEVRALRLMTEELLRREREAQPGKKRAAG